MRWDAPGGNEGEAVKLEKQLWDETDQFRANAKLKLEDYCDLVPVSG